MKKLTKTMMIIGALGTTCCIGTYMYKNNNKKLLKKYETYLNN